MSLNEKLEKEFAMLVPNAVLTGPEIVAIKQAIRLCLEEWFEKQKFDSYEEGFSCIHWYQAIKNLLLSSNESRSTVKKP